MSDFSSRNLLSRSARRDQSRDAVSVPRLMSALVVLATLAFDAVLLIFGVRRGFVSCVELGHWRLPLRLTPWTQEAMVRLCIRCGF